jgi:hypothetical protein
MLALLRGLAELGAAVVKLVATPTVRKMISRSKSKAVCVLCLAVLTSGCGNVSDSLSPDYHEKKGLAYIEQGALDKAEEELKLAISLVARSAGPKAGPVGRMNAELADLYKKENKLEFADEGYRRALIVLSEKPELLTDADREAWIACLRNYAEVLRATGRKDEAEIRESQADRILEKMRKSAPTKSEPALPAEKTAQPPAPPSEPATPENTSQPESKGQQTEESTPKQPMQDKSASMKAPANAEPEQPQAKTSPGNTKPEQPQAKTSPAKTEPAEQPHAKTPPAKTEPEQPQAKTPPAKTEKKGTAGKPTPTKEPAKTK